MNRNIVIFLLVIITQLIGSCKKDAVFMEKEYSRVKTLEVSEVSPYGAVFNGEISVLGAGEISNMGFIYTLVSPVATKVETVYVDIIFEVGKFSYSISHNLFDHQRYLVQAFVKTSSIISLGEGVEFVSSSSIQDGWQLVADTGLDISDQSIISFSSENYGYFFTRPGSCYQFDPKSYKIEKKKSPSGYMNKDNYGQFELAENFYFLSPGVMDIVVYSELGDSWTNQGALAFPPYGSENALGFSISNTGYYLWSGNLISYDGLTSQWLHQSHTIPTNSSSLSVFGDNVFMVSYDPKRKITTKFNPVTFEVNKQLAPFPGELAVYNNVGGELVTARLGDKLYYGLSHYEYHYLNGTIIKGFSNELWQYSPTTDTWLEVASFPDVVFWSRLFHFTCNNEFFVGYRDAHNKIKIWKLLNSELP